MNRFRKNTISLSLAFGAALVFVSLTLGGAFAHERIHHHANQQEQSNCAFAVLVLQWLLSIVPIVGITVILTVLALCPSLFVGYFISPRFSSLGRAPPVSLI